MNKTIEELAKQYAEDMCPIGDYCGGVYDEQRNIDIPIYIDDAKSVLTWLFDKPLRDRLTAEEKKEPNFKVGDKVVINCAYENGEIWDKVMHGRVGTIKSIYRNAESSLWMYGFVEGFRDFAEGWLKPYTEPTEEKTPETTRKSPSEAVNCAKTGISEAETTQKSPSEKKYGSITIPVEVDLTDSFWDAYTADLAKEIAVKVANKFNDPEETAYYVVKVAKAVVEGLKKK